MTPALSAAVDAARKVLDRLYCPYTKPVRSVAEARKMLQAMSDRGLEMVVQYERLQQAIQGASK